MIRKSVKRFSCSKKALSAVIFIVLEAHSRAFLAEFFAPPARVGGVLIKP
jgi:hypothetical protein